MTIARLKKCFQHKRTNKEESKQIIDNFIVNQFDEEKVNHGSVIRLRHYDYPAEDKQLPAPRKIAWTWTGTQ